MRTRDMVWSREILLFLLFSAVLFLTFPNSSTQAAVEKKAIDKNHVSCVMCHRTSTPEYYEAAMKSGDLDMSAVCMDCHLYGENHHPVNFVPDKAPTAGFPLIDGQMKCLTCHEAHGNNKKSHANLLRGAPYKDRREMCFACHPMDEYTDLNPHKMLDAGGNIRKVNNESICLVCHSKVPNQSNPKEQITFKADVAFLCWRCHPPMPNNFFAGHYLAKPSKKTFRYMKDQSQENNVTLPLLNRNRVTCSTCHNPHQGGIIKNAATASGADMEAQLRLPKDKICSACHSH